MIENRWGVEGEAEEGGGVYIWNENTSEIRKWIKPRGRGERKMKNERRDLLPCVKPSLGWY